MMNQLLQFSTKALTCGNQLLGATLSYCNVSLKVVPGAHSHVQTCRSFQSIYNLTINIVLTYCW